MSTTASTATPKRKKRAVQLAVVFWIVILLIVGTMTVIDRCFMVELYNLPTIDKGVADYKDRSYYGWILDGEWEFYYNQWIVTDDIEEPRLDGYLNPGDKWTGTVVNGEKIGREGYASYRFYIDNYKTNYLIYLRAFGKVPTRVYINGVLNTTNATVMSKEKGASRVVADGTMHYAERYPVMADERIEVVLELGYTDNAGTKEIPYISTMPVGLDLSVQDWLYSGFRDECCVATIFTLVILGSILAIANRKSNKSLSLVYFLLSIVLFYLFTIDGLPLLRRIALGSAQIVEYMSFVTPAVAVLALTYHLHRSRIIDTDTKECMRYMGVFALLSIIQLLLYYLLRGTTAQLAALPIFFVAILPIPYYIYRANHPDRHAYVVLGALLILLFLLQMLDVSGALKFSYGLVFAGGILLVSLAIVVLFVLKAYRDDKLLIESAQLERQLKDMQSKALLTQIKPHFIFNSLVLIKDSYHLTKEDGDRAMGLFENHLLAYVKTGELVDVDAELQFVSNYLELEKLRNSGKIEAIFDIDATGFMVPILCIQPLVENAIKYSRIQDRQDGMIVIKTYEQDGYSYIQVVDNGEGFDPAKTRANATGISNVRERIKHYLGGELTIDSTIGQGTTVTIKIKKQ